MNEWSPGGTYRPVIPNQSNQTRSFRSHWDDQNTDKNIAKPVVVNIKAVGNTKSRAGFQQRSQEDIPKPSLSACARTKKTVNGSSDPRFKRVIPAGAQNDACVGTELKHPKTSVIPAVKDNTTINSHDWNALQKPNSQWEDNNQTNIDSMKSKGAVKYGNVIQRGERPTHDSVPEQQNEVHKFSFNHDNMPNDMAKESVSDCTINTRHTSLVSEDVVDLDADKLNTFSSTTRVKKVQNWIADQKPKIDKRQSLITVIGQTQGQSPLSSALHEIDQRRKLVKELDRYAICNKITNSEKEKEINTLVAQINFLSPSGKLLYSGDRKVNLRGMSCQLRHIERLEGGDKSRKNNEMKYDVPVQCDTEGNTEQEASASASDSSNFTQKKPLYRLMNTCDVKGKIRRNLMRIPYFWVAYFMVFLSVALCWYTYASFQRNGFFTFEFFSQKPKATTFYEKLCYWIWEVFRPSSFAWVKTVSTTIYAHLITELPTFYVMESSLTFNL